MTEAQYIGSLVVENIRPKPKGEPSIEMIISSDINGNIIADAVDLDKSTGGEHHVLTVSLQSLDETAAHEVDVPDFDLETDEPPSGLYEHSQQIREKDKRSPKMGAIVLIGLLILLGLAAIWLFLFGGLEKVFPDRFGSKPAAESASPDPIKQEPAKQEPVRQSDPAPQRVEPTPVIQAPASPPPPRQQPQQTSGRRPPVASYNVPATIPREGVDYRIRWGDTLWDISAAFYRDPWLYPRIARHNNIRNPDFIISGRTINIPPKN
jgi:hypothetical protein